MQIDRCVTLDNVEYRNSGYYGFDVVRDRSGWWIMDDRGGERFCGSARPSAADIAHHVLIAYGR